MDELEQYRKRIDAIDEELEALIEERLSISEKVAQYKISNHLSLFQGAREQEILEKAKKRLHNSAYAEEISTFFTTVMEIGKNRQRKLFPSAPKQEGQSWAKVGYQGLPGSFSEETAIKVYGSEIKKNFYKTFEDLFRALAAGIIDEAILPMENSSTGAISQVYDLLLHYGFFITGERTLRISQNLLALPGTKPEEIKEVYSHPQGFAQSANFLHTYPQWRQIPYYNTATAAKYIRDLGSREKAAIAGTRAAELYGLAVLAKNIQDNPNNYTRFVTIKKTYDPNAIADKASIVLSLEDKAGHLYHLLRFFAENQINLVKIESRPIQNRPWKYFLYLDFEGEVNSIAAKKTLAEIQKKAGFFQFLGAYRRNG